MDLDTYLATGRGVVDEALDRFLPQEDARPAVLHRAMRYSVFAGGKRLRPILAMAAVEAVGGDPRSILPLAVALECIHTYSLIHDDLPAMDDDDLRRGKATVHKVFDEATAILAGDALLALAFEALSSPGMARMRRPERVIAVIGELSAASGSRQLVAGQMSDLLSEGKPVTREDVEYIVWNKTAALIRAATKCGALLAGGSLEEVALLSRYGENLGAAFQIKDDLLDLEGDAAKLGKAVRKDEKRGKATFPRLLGRDEARALMAELLQKAQDAVRSFGERAEPLVMIGGYILKRVN
ncbi:MAG: polyprenyl synthetase family protein [Deltaproteobacteria bacterium]|nr:polyprenyl synthetase family protein [Deltaproteobacteria bacterium]